MAHACRNLKTKAEEGSKKKKKRDKKFPKTPSTFSIGQHTNEQEGREEMNVVHGLKRIPRIKFPQRHLKPSEGTKQVENEADTFFFSNLNTPKTTIGGKASLQPKRTPVSNDEMEAILVRYLLLL
ncbi:hypothetical protein Bca101_086698 [Brassica carinata]